MIWQWTGLAVLTLTLLPTGVAPPTGRAPRRQVALPAPTHPRGRAPLTRYEVAPVDATPRPAAAGPATALGGAPAVAECTTVAFTTRDAGATAR
ncbi:hypothetical protein [Streptomyces sp. WMMC940]|uniref:hypothetical protein n=1 Tax=Streptomyces sp. WMMC940 TaxID=3015153 RepID=UPI0022B6BB06|nr:hypothetical protein [Streptomyces sp. WMMC940]MCZ7460228.1 hypothetical protein [Streptomyces sp. WMMC940]